MNRGRIAGMGSRAWWIATLLVSGSAYAQAPGENWGDGTGAPGMSAPQPPVFEPPPCDCIANVMANRWSVGLSVGSFATTPDQGYTDTQNFDIGELALRFRATPHLELEVEIGGGNENVHGDSTNISVRTAAFNLRYRFMIHSHWNWWVMGGLGMVAIAPDDASSDVVDENTRPLYQVGIGLEHRWQQFALHAELRATGLGEAKGQEMSYANDGTYEYSGKDDTYSGGTFTLGASYYF
ncbi:MAG TPA: outer membrane beta-barrel protein [Kofleriaceae bacterium]